MSNWEESIPGRERTPQERAIEREDRKRHAFMRVLAEDDVQLLKKVRSEMRRLKPHFFVVFTALLEFGDLWARFDRDGDVELEHEIFHGFYTEMAKKLGITPNAVKYRAKVSLKWFVKRARFHITDGGRMR